jgi:type I restriction enzyme, R subunit
MRKAIEEGFILDVLQNYTTYQTYWKLLKTAETIPCSSGMLEASAPSWYIRLLRSLADHGHGGAR